MDQNFRVIVPMRSPLVLSDCPMTLDGLLAGLAFRRWRDPERAMREVPLARWCGIPCGSSILLGKVYQVETAKIIKTPSRAFVGSRVHDLVSDVPNKKIDVTTGEFMSIVSEYRTVSPKHVFFFGRGDIDAVRAVLQRLHFLGKLHSKGYGEVGPQPNTNGHAGGIIVEKVEATSDNFGIFAGDDVLIRPVPLSLMNRLPARVRSLPTQERSWELPYLVEHGATIERCFVPDGFEAKSYTNEEIEALTQEY